MDWYGLIMAIVELVLAGVLAWLAANYLKTQASRNRVWNLTTIAHDLVLWVEDAYPDWNGAEKLRKAVELLLEKMDEAGWDDVPREEAEIAVRAAYQKEIGVEKTMLEKAKALEATFKKEG